MVEGDPTLAPLCSAHQPVSPLTLRNAPTRSRDRPSFWGMSGPVAAATERYRSSAAMFSAAGVVLQEGFGLPVSTAPFRPRQP